MYAPKDDNKHRALWRDLYGKFVTLRFIAHRLVLNVSFTAILADESEGRLLRQLVSSATQNDVGFVYALSPGIDIRYSDEAELESLKRKLQQVASFGVRHFALLFDDIEPQLNEADAQRFASFAHAHCYVTNYIFDRMNAYFEAQATASKCEMQEESSPTPKTVSTPTRNDIESDGRVDSSRASANDGAKHLPLFLFCPTEYCSTRCVPSFSDSTYLHTVGALLDSRIFIMWTGPRVVSRTITTEHLHELYDITRRR